MKVPTLFPEGQGLKVKFQLPEPEGPVELEGRVVWSSKIEDVSHPVFGTGVQFNELLPPSRDRLYRFISKALRSMQSRASKGTS